MTGVSTQYGQLNFGFNSGTNNYSQSITNITQAPVTGGTAQSPFYNAYVNGQAALTAASNAGASAAQQNEFGLDYMWVNLGFRFFNGPNPYGPPGTVQCFINGIPLVGAAIYSNSVTSSATYNASAKTQAFPNTPSSALGQTNAILNAGNTNFPTAYLTPVVQFTTATATAQHMMVDWVAAAQVN